MYGVQAGGRLPGTPLYVAVEEGGEVIWDQEDCLSAATAAARCGWRVAARQEMVYQSNSVRPISIVSRLLDLDIRSNPTLQLIYKLLARAPVHLG